MTSSSTPKSINPNLAPLSYDWLNDEIDTQKS